MIFARAKVTPVSLPDLESVRRVDADSEIM